MSSSADSAKMKIFGQAEQWAFEKTAKESPELARLWLERLEACDWENYLTEMEAETIMDGLINQDGNVGSHWSLQQIESLNLPLEQKPYYNKYALAAVMNMLASDHLISIREYLPEEDIAGFVYKLAIEKLTDPDRPRFVRDYFGL